MPLREHLREARRRVVLMVLGLLVGAVVGWLVYPQVFEAMYAPIAAAAEAHGRDIDLNFPATLGPLDLQIKVSLAVGVVVSSPWWVYQLWAFVGPGLTRTERRYTVGFVAAGVPLFLAGVTVAWLVIPTAMHVLIGFTPADARNLLDAQLYFGFIMRVVLAFGLGFVLPVFMVVLNFAGLVGARTWLAGWRWAVLIAFLFGAVVTPTQEVISMVSLALPICLLYFAAVGVCWLHDRRAGTLSPAHRGAGTEDEQ